MSYVRLSKQLETVTVLLDHAADVYFYCCPFLLSPWYYLSLILVLWISIYCIAGNFRGGYFRGQADLHEILT